MGNILRPDPKARVGGTGGTVRLLVGVVVGGVRFIIILSGVPIGVEHLGGSGVLDNDDDDFDAGGPVHP